MRRIALLGVMLLGLLWAWPPATWPAPAEQPRDKSILTVGVVLAEPFVIANPDGAFSGIAIDLWRAMAKTMGLRYEIHVMSTEDLLRGLRDGTMDLAVTNLTATAEREEFCDFSHSYYQGGLGIAVLAQADQDWWRRFKRLLVSRQGAVMLLILVCLFFVGALVWLAERRHNHPQFGGGALSGLGSGIWWAAQTLTSVGYGDKAPVTVAGRLLAGAWMLASLVLASLFTAVITAALTLARLDAPVNDFHDLYSARVGTVRSSSSAAYLEDLRVDARGYPTPAEGLHALEQGRLDAVVFDEPVLRYLVKRQFTGKLKVLPQTFNAQAYCFAMPNGSSLRDAINKAMLQLIQSPDWHRLLFTYLGGGGGGQPAGGRP